MLQNMISVLYWHAMKKEIHPKYYENAKVTCSCGNIFTVGSTKETLQIEICSKCHPFYTGTEKILDTAGRVERFKARQAAKTTSILKKKGVKSTSTGKKK